ncbi:unnamed protein product [Calypogeia fissa]
MALYQLHKPMPFPHRPPNLLPILPMCAHTQFFLPTYSILLGPPLPTLSSSLLPLFVVKTTTSCYWQQKQRSSKSGSYSKFVFPRCKWCCSMGGFFRRGRATTGRVADNPEKENPSARPTLHDLLFWDCRGRNGPDPENHPVRGLPASPSLRSLHDDESSTHQFPGNESPLPGGTALPLTALPFPSLVLARTFPKEARGDERVQTVHTIQSFLSAVCTGFSRVSRIGGRADGQIPEEKVRFSCLSGLVRPGLDSLPYPDRGTDRPAGPGKGGPGRGEVLSSSNMPCDCVGAECLTPGVCSAAADRGLSGVFFIFHHFFWCFYIGALKGEQTRPQGKTQNHEKCRVGDHRGAQLLLKLGTQQPNGMDHHVL